MAIKAFMFGKAIMSAFKKDFTLDNGATGLKCMLLTNAQASAFTDLTTAQDTWQYKSSITSEVTGTNYTAGGVSISPATVTYTAGTNLITIDAPDASWPTSTITAYYAVVYDSTPATDAQRPLLCWVDFGGPMTSTAGTFAVVWDPTGIVNITATVNT